MILIDFLPTITYFANTLTYVFLYFCFKLILKTILCYLLVEDDSKASQKNAIEQNYNKKQGKGFKSIEEKMVDE